MNTTTSTVLHIPENKRIDSPVVDTQAQEVIINIKGLDFHYSKNSDPALKDVSLPIYKQQVTALIGPSGCGKSTLLRCLNRIYSLYGQQHAMGEINYEGDNILTIKELNDLRSKIGMIFQKPTPFPMSIFENIAFGLRLDGKLNKSQIKEKVEQALRSANLWEEVKNKLHDDASGLSGGQQQRLCIARTIALEPAVILMDEPTSALDPIATSAIEDLITKLREQFTIVIVTHNMQQAMRISDNTAFMYLGELVEFSPTRQLFNHPTEEQTKRYISGDFG